MNKLDAFLNLCSAVLIQREFFFFRMSLWAATTKHSVTASCAIDALIHRLQAPPARYKHNSSDVRRLGTHTVGTAVQTGKLQVDCMYIKPSLRQAFEGLHRKAALAGCQTA
jgi:hypothetical protein